MAKVPDGFTTQLDDRMVAVAAKLATGGVFMLRRHYEDDENHPGMWVCSMEFGREAPDSPMAGGAGYGFGGTWEEAVDEALNRKHPEGEVIEATIDLGPDE
jgi:hypothetical protein